MKIDIDHYHEVFNTESDIDKVKKEMMELLQITIDIFFVLKASEDNKDDQP
jgi:hypothetical protein